MKAAKAGGVAVAARAGVLVAVRAAVRAAEATVVVAWVAAMAKERRVAAREATDTTGAATLARLQ